MKNKNLQLIQALRGIASLLVVLFHTTANASEILKITFLSGFFNFGSAGVDVFFVLSGFIITYTSLGSINKSKKFSTFIYRRFIRIFPTYWFIISLFLLAQILLPSFYRTHFSFDIKNIFFTYLLLPGHAMVNGVSWTLSYELFFYLIFCFAFIIRSKKIAFAVAILYGFILILLPLLGYNYENENPWINLITFPMNVEFIMGVIAALIIVKLPQRFCLPFIVGGSLIFIIDGVFSNADYHIFSNSFNRVVLFGIPAFFVITGLVKYELNKKIIVPKMLLNLGEASYSLYLIHLPVIVAAFKILARLNIKNTLVTHLCITIIIVIICYACILFYQTVEKPILNKLNSLRKIKVPNEI